MAATSPFRAAFGPGEWERLAAWGERIVLEDGAVVLSRGDPPSWVFVVEDGQLDAVDPRTSPPTVLGVFSAGAVLGELSFMDGAPVSADVRARGRTTCLRFSIARLGEALGVDSQIDAAFHRGIAAEMVKRTRSLTSSAVTGSIGRKAQRSETLEIALGATGGPAEQVHKLMARGLDPHLATAITDQRFPERTVALTGDRARIGSAEDCDVVLPDVRVSASAAECVRAEDRWRVVSTCTRAVVVDGEPVASAPLEPGSAIQVGRYDLRFTGESFEIRAPTDTFLLRARDLGRDVDGRTILDGVGFAALSGEVIALIGPSGAGKTTLLDALRGRADRGTVEMDGADFFALLRDNPAVLGEVPQDDIVLPELTVEESLVAASRLRLPRASEAERRGVVNRVIDALGLERIRGSRIGDPERRGISGGQRKRVNIAQEVLTDATRVLFLDEPTSGLDPRSAADIARLCRRLADQGKVVLVVTHDVGQGVLDQVDHLLVMVPGGRLAWFGPAAEAAAHFGAAHPAEIFDRLADRTPVEWEAAFRESVAYGTWVKRRLELADGLLEPAPPPPPAELPSLGAQLAVLVGRNARVKLRDVASIGVLVAQPLLVAAVVLLVFQRATAGLVFLVVLASFWFGMSSSVRELIADQVVWRRERGLGLSPLAWVGSKGLVLGTAVALQCTALAGVAWAGAGLGGLGFGPVRWVATAVLTGWTGLGTGLLVSSLWRRSEAAVGTIVLLLVPQIAFSGVLMSLKDVRGGAWALSWLTPVRYAFHLALSGGDELEYLNPLRGEWYARPIPGELALMGLRASGEDPGLPPAVLAAALGGWTLLACLIAVLRVRRT